VLFDSDGVLVDSDASVARAWARWARSLGLDPTAVGGMVHGRRAADTVALLVDAPQRVDALARIDAYELEDALTVAAIAGALPLTASIPADRWAVVTSANAALAAARLRAAGLGRPGALVTADDVAAGKPAPDGYQAAAGLLGQPPQACVVLEDSESGVAAARAAGVATVIGIGERALRTDADIVVPDLRSLRHTEAGLLVLRSAALRL
jgi:sugar-phosphatase